MNQTLTFKADVPALQERTKVRASFPTNRFTPTMRDWSHHHYWPRLCNSPLFRYQKERQPLTIIKNNLHSRLSALGRTQKSYSLKLHAHHMPCKGRLWLMLERGTGRDLRLTWTTLVRSKQSIQLTLNTPFCFDRSMLFETQKNLFYWARNVEESRMTEYSYPWFSNTRSSWLMSLEMFSYLLISGTRYP